MEGGEEGGGKQRRWGRRKGRLTESEERRRVMVG